MGAIGNLNIVAAAAASAVAGFLYDMDPRCPFITCIGLSLLTLSLILLFIREPERKRE